MTAPSAVPEDAHHPKASFWTLLIGSVGVVYGDIGTSPLYALREALVHSSDDGLEEMEVIGIVSLLLWTLTLIVTLKYVFLILRADNRGEGGTLSLLALAQQAVGRRTTLLFLLGVFGAALFYGDAIITPAISVLSAVEGLKLVTPAFDPYVLPISVFILVALFAVQSRGTGMVSAWFGPITVVWFVVLGLLGLLHVGDNLAILNAFNPVNAVGFVIDHGMMSLAVLGSVFLAVTGAEALYADMGHFGRRPIQMAWMWLVFPALALNYLGQGSLVLANPAALENPFFLLAPDWALLPLVILATMATVIASQAVISGAFSLSQQAVQLGLLPRLEIQHTSDTQVGQIYMPRVNWLMLAGVLILVLSFGSSGALASAYGISVTGEMVITSFLAFVVFWKVWRWSLWFALLVVVPIVSLELIFFGANLIKVLDGGYVPLLFAATVAGIMWTWVKGTRIVQQKARAESVPLLSLIGMLEKSVPAEAPGTAVYLTSDPEVAPSALLHNLKHNHVLHARNLIVTVSVAPQPRVAEEDRAQVSALSDRFTRIQLRFGYMEQPNVPKALAYCKKVAGIKFDIMSTSFFLNRRSFRPAQNSVMSLWQNRLYISMTKGASDATGFYRLPTNRVVEMGQQFNI